MYKDVLRVLHALTTIVLMLLAGRLQTIGLEILAQLREADHVSRDVMRK
jgi:hypothetical protein